MSLDALLQAALVAALKGNEAVAGLAGGVFDAPPVRAALPHLVVQETVFGDWSTKDMAGREGRITLVMFDEGERPLRLRALAGAVEGAVSGMPPVLGEGWRIVSLAFVRRRTVHAGGVRWAAISEFRVRALRES